MKRRAFELLVPHPSGGELLLQADNPQGDDLKVYVYEGDISVDNYIEVKRPLPHFLRHFTELFQQAHLGERRDPMSAAKAEKEGA